MNHLGVYVNTGNEDLTNGGAVVVDRDRFNGREFAKAHVDEACLARRVQC
jgi:hypothetical protein